MKQMPDDIEVSCFIDTNIWLYAFIDSGETDKSTRARELIQATQPTISTQVINEVCVNLVKKASFREEQLRMLIDSFYEKYDIVSLDQDLLIRASELSEQYSLSFWDSMIVASALYAKVRVLYSEDMQNGLVVEGKLQIVSPFQ
jgi:predicted nucleic acid-binding protein